MKKRRQSFLVAIVLATAFAGSSAMAIPYTPQSYRAPATYNSVPQYNSVQKYNSVPPYNSVKPAALKNYNPVNGSNASNRYGSNGRTVWYQNLTKEHEHNFGVVARASKQEHVFEFINTTGNDLFLTGVRTSCGCTKPLILTSHVKPGEKAQVNARFDTLNFYGSRGATLTVSMKKSGTVTEYGELQFAVKGEIRRDVVLSPGEIAFDNISLSEQAQRTVKVMYAGNPQWKIIEVKSTNPNVVAEAREVERSANNNRVTYELIVKLNDQQNAGSFNEFLTIVTNDSKTTGMPVYVKGKVNPLIEVQPIHLGVVNRGQTIKKKLIIQSSRAISVEEIKTSDPRIKFDPVDGEKTLHILAYTLDTSRLGEISEELTIVTNDPGQPETKVPFSVQIVPATIAGTSN